ncbi:Zinc-type alcohol dehydrogenase-like protein C16A3.02c [Leucoagaricus sp. SymC.cos]|nr:Zinc-type alcohol dehydrogenase-like protein C16A3.02c [Leucoagaricus sp. SymC.cos]
MASQKIPNVQKAWLCTAQGKPAKSLKHTSDWPVPKKLEPGEVLIRVQAAALNPVGWKLMKMLPNFIARRPHVAEHDLAGVVVGSNGNELKAGDEVFGWVPMWLTAKTGQGALAQFVRVPEDHLVCRPKEVTPVEAAGLTLAGLTAYQAIHEIANVTTHQTVFVSGGSTAVGAFAIQFAKAIGAKVIATASGKNEAFVRGLGADEFIDYTKINIPQELTQKPPYPKFNVIFDAVGNVDPSLYTQSEAYLAPNGVFVTTGPFPQTFSVSEIWKLFRTFSAIITPRWLGGTNREYKFVSVKNSHEDLKKIAKLIRDGMVKPVIDSVFNFDDTVKAFDRIMTTRATGKVVVKVYPSVD